MTNEFWKRNSLVTLPLAQQVQSPAYSARQTTGDQYQHEAPLHTAVTEYKHPALCIKNCNTKF
jgi:hypothetical protein